MFLLIIRNTNLNILKYNVELYQSSFIFLWMSYCYAPFLTYCHTHASLSQWRRIRYVMWAFKWIWHCFRIAQDKLKRKKIKETLFWNIFISDAFHRNMFWSYFQVKWYTNKLKKELMSSKKKIILSVKRTLQLPYFSKSIQFPKVYNKKKPIKNHNK